jgi:hypothetical protein
MNQLRCGDVVRVVNSFSVWRGVRGMIVDVIERDRGDGGGKVQECAVNFGDHRCWFMVEHLVKVVPVNMVRFFRSEAIERWHLDPDRAESLDGRRDQLITFLQECCGFSTSCASREVDDFLRALDEKIQQATQVAPERQPQVRHRHHQDVAADNNKSKPLNY